MAGANARESLRLVWEHYGAKRYAEVLEVAAAGLPTMTATPTAEWGEVSRLAMISAIALENMDQELLWRVQAASQFFQSSCGNGMALVLIPEAFRMRHAAALALSAFDAILSLIGPPDLEFLTERQARSVLVEKRGFVELTAGKLDVAMRDYEAALALAGPGRRNLKVRGGLANVLWTMAPPDDRAAREGILAETESIAKQANDLRSAADVASWAAANVEIMRTAVAAGVPGDQLIPYEIV